MRIFDSWLGIIFVLLLCVALVLFFWFVVIKLILLPVVLTIISAVKA